MMNDIKNTKTNDKKYQEVLTRNLKIIGDAVCPVYSVGIEHRIDNNTIEEYYDVFPSLSYIRRFILEETIYGRDNFEDIKIYTHATLNPFDVKPSIIDKIRTLNTDYVIAFLIIEANKYKLGLFAFECMMDVVKKRIDYNIRDYLGVEDKFNYYYEYHEIDNNYIVLLKADPNNRNKATYEEKNEF